MGAIHQEDSLTDLAIAFALLFGLTCGLLAVVHSMSAGRMTMLDWSLMALGGMYGVGWAIVMAGTRSGVNPLWDEWLLPHEGAYSLHTAAASVLTFGVILGWYIAGKVFGQSPVTLRSIRHPSSWSWSFAFWMILALAVVFQWLYTYVYGGFLGILSYSADIRSGVFPVDNPLSFLSPFGGLSLISTLGFWGLWLSGKRSLWLFLGLGVSFVFSIYILYSWLGRMGFLVYIAAFPLALAVMRIRSPLNLLAICVAGFSLLLLFAYVVSVSMGIKSADSLMAFLSRELSFPFISFFTQLHLGEHLFLVFRDFLAVPLYLLPSSLWLQWLEPIGQVNTAVIMGAPKGEDGVTGAIPVDLLTAGIMQVHLVGIPVVGMLFGAFIRFLQFLLDRIPFLGIRAAFHAYLALKIGVLAAFYAQPNQIVSGNFALILAAFILFICVRVGRIYVFRSLSRPGYRGGANS